MRIISLFFVFIMIFTCVPSPWTMTESIASEASLPPEEEKDTLSLDKPMEMKGPGEEKEPVSVQLKKKTREQRAPDQSEPSHGKIQNIS
ncbi:hypothetical protein GXN76_04340 [Kroppenstedtia pulmonis]|uniref:Uncharacterized protein n=1 Tax=Kroppenstedtia pulmonis TaxID=1380685 RepID=A0A7D3Y8P6_9BACL|nr:hypothetical protein [Kroppenstedtia pulmonis]QKG83781.1 hypothetical protein GXN76_04340 [Kroppenstedtia pulmonis]